MLAVVALLALSSVQAFHSEAAGWWHPSDHSDQRGAGEWIAANTRPGDRVADPEHGRRLLRRAADDGDPLRGMNEILRYARHYGARYLVVDWYTAVRLRPQLAPLRTTDRMPGLRLAHEVRAEGRTTRIFAARPAAAQRGPIGSSLGFVDDGQSAVERRCLTVLGTTSLRRPVPGSPVEPWPKGRCPSGCQRHVRSTQRTQPPLSHAAATGADPITMASGAHSNGLAA